MLVDILGKPLNDAVIGVAGCGAMGLPMAKALLAAGYNVIGYDVRAAEEFGDFARHMVSSPRKLAETADILISVVRDQQQTLDLYFDKQAVFSDDNHPRICLISSTVSPRFLTDVQGRLPADTAFFDIPMSGAPIAAEERRLTFMVGSDEATAAAIAPLLHAMGRRVHFLGGFARGMACKVLNNFVAASSVVAVRQVLAEATKLGIAPEQLLAVMKESSGANWFGDNFEAITWSREDYDPTNTIAIIEKDVDSLLDALAHLSTPVDAATTAYMDAVRSRLSAMPPAPAKENHGRRTARQPKQPASR